MAVSARTLRRWEKGTVEPTHLAQALMTALREKLRKDPAQRSAIISLVRDSAAQGVQHLLLHLLDAYAVARTTHNTELIKTLVDTSAMAPPPEIERLRK
jgi:DNA-binding TFAR19-related protein (PDSD5 family)